MKLKKIDKLEDYQQLTDTYSINKIFSNDYIQSEVSELISKSMLFEHHTESNLFIFVKKNIFPLLNKRGKYLLDNHR